MNGKYSIGATCLQILGRSVKDMYITNHVLMFTRGIWLLSDVSYSDECQTKKYFQYAENMIPLFLVILKFCSANICLQEKRSRSKHISGS